MRLFSWTLLLLALSWSGFATAQEDVPESRLIGTITGGQESEGDTLRRAAQMLAQYTDRTQLMGCGLIAVDARGVLHMDLRTNQAHVGCVSDATLRPGLRSTGVFIQSTPTERRVVANEADEALSAAFGMRVTEGMGLVMNGSALASRNQGPTYLIVGTRWFFQQGRGRVQDLGSWQEHAGRGEAGRSPSLVQRLMRPRFNPMSLFTLR